MSDEVFRLGWLDDPEPGLAERCLAFLREKAAQYAGQGVFEEDTKAIFVEPLLRGLGWDTLDCKQVGREYPRRDPLGDIGLCGKDQNNALKIAALIEAKPLDAPPEYMRDTAYSQ